MTQSHPRDLETLLICNARYSYLFRQAEELLDIAKQLKVHLPPPLNQHVTVANFRGNTLVLHTSSPTWCTKARYLEQEIIKCLKNSTALKELRHIIVKVSVPSQYPNDEVLLPRPRLSAQTADFLKQTADSVSDPALKATFLAIAELATRKMEKPK